MSKAAVAAMENPMRKVGLAKVVLNIGVGRAGEGVERAKKILEELTSQTPSGRRAKKSIRDFGVHLGEPIGAATTLRGELATEVLRRLLQAKDSRIPESSFDQQGNCSFGIREHIDIPGVRYRPELGIFGMDVAVVLERPGYRVSRRRRGRASIGGSHRVSREDAISYLKTDFGVEVS